jgi:hypothetical protein
MMDVETVGDYKLVFRLGCGSFATVWLGEHRLTGCKVAIKVVLRSSLDSADAVTRFTREVSLFKQMSHPFIADFFEILEDSNAYYMVMEYVEHGNILDFVNTNGRLTEDRARRYFCELISALDYLHNVKLIAHRDLKAENVMLDRNDNIRLIDFGLSNSFTKGHPTLRTACGSPAYAAPEMIKGCSYTKAADMWSAGILLYAMVAGHLPYDDENIQTLLHKVLAEEVEYPPTMSRSLVDMLKRLLAKNPAVRITIDRLKEHPWFSQCEYSVLIGFNTRVFYNDSPLDRDVVFRMTCLGIDCRDLAQNLITGEYTGLTSIYRQFRREKITELMKTLLDEMKTLDRAINPLMVIAATSQYPEPLNFGFRQRGITGSTPMHENVAFNSAFGQVSGIIRGVPGQGRRVVLESNELGPFTGRPRTRLFGRRLPREMTVSGPSSIPMPEATLVGTTARRPSFEHP